MVYVLPLGFNFFLTYR